MRDHDQCRCDFVLWLDQKFVSSIENIEKAAWADQAVFGSTEKNIGGRL
jgi:hypothetical protein